MLLAFIDFDNLTCLLNHSAESRRVAKTGQKWFFEELDPLQISWFLAENLAPSELPVSSRWISSKFSPKNLFVAEQRVNIAGK